MHDSIKACHKFFSTEKTDLEDFGMKWNGYSEPTKWYTSETKIFAMLYKYIVENHER